MTYDQRAAMHRILSELYEKLAKFNKGNGTPEERMKALEVAIVEMLVTLVKKGDGR